VASLDSVKSPLFFDRAHLRQTWLQQQPMIDLARQWTVFPDVGALSLSAL
jgi:hypothetical protein